MTQVVDNAGLESFTLELGRGTEVALAAIIATMMFSVALGLKPKHFGFFRTAPRIFLGGLTGQMLVLPLLTLALCFLWNPQPSIALGMILIACCPGGNVSNMLVLLARGNAALSVSLTAASSISAAFITPVAIVFWSGLYPPTSALLTQIDFNAVSFLVQTAVILALPLLLGMITVSVSPVWAARLRQPLITISALGLVVIIVFGTLKYFDQLLTIGVGILGLVVLHNALAFLSGFLTAKIFRADQASRRAITFEVGIQNSGLGIVILLTQLGGIGGAAAVTGLWGTWHVVGGLLLVGLFRLTDRYAKL